VNKLGESEGERVGGGQAFFTFWEGTPLRVKRSEGFIRGCTDGTIIVFDGKRKVGDLGCLEVVTFLRDALGVIGKGSNVRY